MISPKLAELLDETRGRVVGYLQSGVEPSDAVVHVAGAPPLYSGQRISLLVGSYDLRIDRAAGLRHPRRDGGGARRADDDGERQPGAQQRRLARSRLGARPDGLRRRTGSRRHRDRPLRRGSTRQSDGRRAVDRQPHDRARGARIPQPHGDARHRRPVGLRHRRAGARLDARHGAPRRTDGRRDRADQRRGA